MLDKEETTGVVRDVVTEGVKDAVTEVGKDTETEVVKDVVTEVMKDVATEKLTENIGEEQEPNTKHTGYRSEIDGIEVDFELQYRDRETDMKDIAGRVTEDYAKRGNDASKIELIQVYLKPTDFTAYYVINNSYEGKIPLF